MPETDPANLGRYSFARAATAEDAVHWAIRAAAECPRRIKDNDKEETHLQKIGDALLARLAELGPAAWSSGYVGRDVYDNAVASATTRLHALHALMEAARPLVSGMSEADRANYLAALPGAMVAREARLVARLAAIVDRLDSDPDSATGGLAADGGTDDSDEADADEPCDGLDFGAALRLLQSGARVRRTGWNGQDMHVALMPGYPDGVQANETTARAHDLEPGSWVIVRPYLVMWAADGSIVNWTISQSDALAKDWEIVP